MILEGLAYGRDLSDDDPGDYRKCPVSKNLKKMF